MTSQGAVLWDAVVWRMEVKCDQRFVLNEEDWLGFR